MISNGAATGKTVHVIRVFNELESDAGPTVATHAPRHGTDESSHWYPDTLGLGTQPSNRGQRVEQSPRTAAWT